MAKDIIADLNWRYAIKIFDPNKKISEKDFNTILEVLRLTPSSFGFQGWKFVVVNNPDIRKKLVPYSWNQSQITDASHLIVLCRIKKITPEIIEKYIELKAKTLNLPVSALENSKKRFQDFLNNKSEEEKITWLRNQVYIALGNLLTACAIMKIDTCPIEGFEPEKYDEILELEKKGLKTVVACAIGYRSKNDAHAFDKKIRYPKEEVIIEIN